jgi:hypothetical protein
MSRKIRNRSKITNTHILQFESRYCKNNDGYTRSFKGGNLVTIRGGNEFSVFEASQITSILKKSTSHIERTAETNISRHSVRRLQDPNIRVKYFHSKGIDFERLTSKLDIKRKPIKVEHLPIGRATNLDENSILFSLRDLDITLGRINELKEDEEEDEYGEIIKPTEYANKTAIELVSKAAKSIPEKFFKAWVSTEDSGGIGLTWSKPELEKEVRLVIPPTSDRKIYLYHEMCDEYGVEYNVSAKTLSHWLSWCNPR